MKQVVITKTGGAEVLEVQEVANPLPGAGEVVIQVRASGINFADILARQGLYPDAPKIPCVVGYEVSGIVEAVGSGVDGGMVGQEVIALTRFKGYAEKVKVPSNQVFAKPADLSFEQAAAIPVTYLTAYQLIVVMGSLQPSESILIHNAGGGVGLAALDIAKQIGATTYGTASPHKHAFLKERGLDYAIDYRTQDWEKVLKRLTDGQGVELIIDPLGGAHWKKSYRALRHTGRLGMFGMSTATESKLSGILRLVKILIQTPFYHPFGLMDNNRGVFGVNLGHLWHENDKIQAWMSVILEGVTKGWIRPHVDKTFPLANAGEAQGYIEARKNIGKVILVT